MDHQQQPQPPQSELPAASTAPTASWDNSIHVSSSTNCPPQRGVPHPPIAAQWQQQEMVAGSYLPRRGSNPELMPFQQQQQQQPLQPPQFARSGSYTASVGSGYTSGGGGGGGGGGYGLPVYGHTQFGQDTSRVDTVDPAAVDSALLAALRDPRERVALLRLEHALTEFCQSQQGWIEVGGLYNSVLVSSPAAAAQAMPQQHLLQTRQSSFQRCVLHRLADRFGIVREPGALLGPASLRLIKVPVSAVPQLLLADYYQTFLASEEAEEDRSNPIATQPATADPPRKMKIMKRSTSQPHQQQLANGNSRGNPNSKKTAAAILEEKERAYAEARARIFSQESLGSSGGGDEAEDDAVATTSSFAASTEASCSGGSLPPTNAAAAVAMDLQQQKAVYRNRWQEEADPDFQRNVDAEPPAPPALHAYQQQQQQLLLQQQWGVTHPPLHTADNAYPPPQHQLQHVPYPVPPQQHQPMPYYASAPTAYAVAQPPAYGVPPPAYGAPVPPRWQQQRASSASTSSGNSSSQPLTAAAPAFVPRKTT